MIALAAGLMVFILARLGWLYLVVFAVFSAVMLGMYIRLLSSYGDTLVTTAGTVNRLGGFYFFAVSGAIFPDTLLRSWFA
jgi:hypothetical protein